MKSKVETEFVDGSGVGGNIQLKKTELAKIRRLDDFDVLMLLSEIHEHGWTAARSILELMPEKN